MKPLLKPVALICLILAANAHPENIEDVKQLPQSKEPVIEAEESEPQARIERCTTCSGSLNLKSPNAILAALQALPGAEVHTQQSFEECTSAKGCAGIKVKDGRVVEKFGDQDEFKAAAAANNGNDFTFHAVGTFGSNGFDASGKPFWWMNQDSPFKNVEGNFEKFSKSSSSSFSSNGGATGAGGALDLAANPFLNGEFTKGNAGFAAQSQSGKPNTFQQSAFESSSFSSTGKEVDISKNPFLNGGFAAGQAGQSSQSAFQAGQANQAGFQAGQSGFQGQNGFNANGAAANGFGAQGQSGQSSFSSNKFSSNGYTGSSPSPFTASTGGSNVNLIQNSQKTSEFDFETQQQTQQNIDEAFQSGGSGSRQEQNGGELHQTCAGQGYVCVHKAQCNNGIVSSNGATILQARTKKQYCNLKNEICCRIEISTIPGAGGLQGSIGAGSATYSGSGSQESGIFSSGSSQNAGDSSSQFGQSGYGANNAFGSSSSVNRASSSSFGQSSSQGQGSSRGQGSLQGQGSQGSQQGSSQGGSSTFQSSQGSSQSSYGSNTQGFGGNNGASASGSFGAGSGSFGANSGTFGAGSGSNNRGVIESSSSSFESSRGTTYNGGSGGKFGATGSFGSTGSGFNSNNPSRFNTNSNTNANGFNNDAVYKQTSQSNFIETDSFSSGSDQAGIYRPGAVGSGLKPGIPYLPPVDNTNSGSNTVSSTASSFSTTRRPITTTKPTYLPPSTSAPGYLPPEQGDFSFNKETYVPGPPKYNEGEIILDETRSTARPPQAPVDVPSGCAAALKCTPIEYCTAEGVISNTTVALTRDQEAYRVPLTDCKDLETGRVGKCCRDPLYTDPWPTNQLGKWVQGVFGGNDGKYVADSRGSGNNPRPQVTARPPVTGSVLLNNFRTPKPTTPAYGPNQVTPGFPATTVSQGSYSSKGQFSQTGQGQIAQGGQGQYSQGGRGQFGVGGQGQVSQGAQGQFAQGSQSQFSSSFGQTAQQGQGQLVSQGQGQLVSQGQGQIVSQGQGQFGAQGQGQFVNQGQREVVTQGQREVVTQGQREVVTQGQGEVIRQGEGQFVQQGQGQYSQGGRGQFGVGAQGQFGQGQGQFTQTQKTFSQTGQTVIQGQEGQRGQGQAVITGQGQTVSQGVGSGFSQGVGSGFSQGSGFSVSQGAGFGLENEYSESVQRVFLQQYNGGGQCGLMSGQKPYGNRNDNEVDFAEIPWQAMVLLQTNRSLLCGGVITRPDVVITSAACVDGLEAKNVLIKGGEWKLGIDDEPLPFQIVQVKNILRHPFYKRGSLKYDAAILVLSENLRFANNIYPICLPSASDTLDAFYNGAGECVVTGWGKQVLQAHLSGSIMHSVNVSLLNPSECETQLSQDYPHLLDQYDQESCACGQPTNPINNICRVDIGSALACTTDDRHFVLRGVYSWDSGCTPGNQIAAFYKFDLEWYEWAIGLIESTRFAQFGGAAQSQRFSGQIKGSQYTSGVKGGVKGGFVSKGFGQFGQGQIVSGGQRGVSSQGSSSQGQISSGSLGQLVASGLDQLSSAGLGQGQLISNGQYSQFNSGKYQQGAGFGAQIKAPITNSFSASYTEKKVFQTEPKFVTYTTKPEIVTFTTKPEIVTFTTKPEYFTYTTKPKIVTYTTKPQIITYETSGSGTSPQYVAPGVSFNPSFTDVVGKQHTHNAQCKCLQNGKK